MLKYLAKLNYFLVALVKWEELFNIINLIQFVKLWHSIFEYTQKIFH